MIAKAGVFSEIQSDSVGLNRFVTGCHEPDLAPSEPFFCAQSPWTGKSSPHVKLPWVYRFQRCSLAAADLHSFFLGFMWNLQQDRTDKTSNSSAQFLPSHWVTGSPCHGEVWISKTQNCRCMLLYITWLSLKSLKHLMYGSIWVTWLVCGSIRVRGVVVCVF